MPSKTDDLFDAMVSGRAWAGMEKNDEARALLEEVFRERCHANDWGLFQARANLQKKASAASYAGWITADNDSSGGYQGTSFVWMPGEAGSVAVLVIGTQGFGADAAILARPGHRRRLRSLSRLHSGRLWVKPDLLDRSSRVPDVVCSDWPEVGAALKTYGDVIYAAVVVRDEGSRMVVEDLIDLFFHEHGVRFKGSARTRWNKRLDSIRAALFPQLTLDAVNEVLGVRKYVILEGPPGTGKTRLARQICENLGVERYTPVQFHPARTYEDFVVGLAPSPRADGLSFRVRAGDLVRANARASTEEHILMIDEINRADLGKVLGEAVQLFESGEEGRWVELAYDLPEDVRGPDDRANVLRMSPHLRVLGTRNTADRSIAPIDLAIRRRFAFLTMWPSRGPVEEQGDALALQCFDDTLETFIEFADDDALALVPGHAYFLDPLPSGLDEGRGARIRGRLRYELLPLLEEYVSARLVGPATTEVQGLHERLATRLGC